MHRKYWNAIQVLVNEQIPLLEKNLYIAAEDIFLSLQKGGIWHLFGSGHSALVVEEAFHRAGGLVQVNPLTEVMLSSFVSPEKNRKTERKEGVAQKILAKHSVRKGEVLWIVSNSGINPSSIDMALIAKKKGLKVIALTCVAHSKAMESRHSSKKRLFEIADYVLDTSLPPGDAILSIPNTPYRFGAASLVVGTVIIHTVEAMVIDKFVQNGLKPPIYMSSNLQGGDQHNKQLEKKFSRRILRMATKGIKK